MTTIKTKPKIQFNILFLLLAVVFLFGIFLIKSNDRFSKRSSRFLAVESPVAAVTTVTAGHTQKISYKITNLWTSPVTIYGVQTSCGCFNASNIPITIPYNQARHVEFEIHTQPGDAGSVFAQEATLFTDAPTPTYRIQIAVEVQKPVSSMP